MTDNMKRVEIIAGRVAKKYLYGNIYNDDVIQQTMIQYYLNIEKVNMDNLTNWVYTVAKNLCIDLHKLDKKNIKLVQDIKINSLDNCDCEFEAAQDISESKSILNEIDSYSFLNNTDKKILKKYIPKEVSLTKLSKSFKIKKNVLKNRIYSALREIKFYKLLESDVVDFNTIPGTKMHANIKNFLNSLEQALKTNNLHKLKNYLKSGVVNSTIDKIIIKKVDSYRVKILGKNQYRIFIAYLNTENNFKVFGINFIITENRNIQITEIPIIPQKVLLINSEYAEGDEGYRALTNVKGTYNGRLGDFKKKIDPNIATIIQDKTEFEE